MADSLKKKRYAFGGAYRFFFSRLGDTNYDKEEPVKAPLPQN